MTKAILKVVLGLQFVGQPMPLGRGAIPILDVGTIVQALRQHFGGTHD